MDNYQKIWIIIQIQDISMNKTTICGIVAIGPDDVIGKNGIMPWYSRQDFYHFRTLTTPYPCIFGKTTFLNLPTHPLPNRMNIVCSSSYKNELCGDIFLAQSVESAIEYCQKFDYVFICGGQKIYEYALNNDLIDIMYITKIYDSNLSQQIKTAPDTYVKFPIKTDMFFGSDKWVDKKMIYPQNVLPKEYGAIKTKFFKCFRAR